VFSRKASFADGCYEDEWNGVAGTPWGLFYGAASQFAAEAIGTITNLVVAFTLPYVFFNILHAIVGMRVPAEVELQGLDVPEMGAEGYAGHVLQPTSVMGVYINS
jgi:Amt family ammonium transporter